MQLTELEQAMLRGAHGPAVQDAIAFQIEVGKYFNAQRLVEISNAHVMGDIEVMGDSGLHELQKLNGLGAKCSVPTSSNAQCMHFQDFDELKQDAQEIAKQKRIIGLYQSMDIAPTNSCIPYQQIYQPKLGEHVAWGDTGTVIYANSVCGARTNFESGKASFAAAITGRTPAYGFHLDAHRRGNILVNLYARITDTAEWGAIGKIVGHPHQDYRAVPVFHGLHSAPNSDDLKHLGASLASYGSMAMYHAVGVTPEAPTLEAAFGGNTPRSTIDIHDADIARVFERYQIQQGARSIVVFSGPQLSLFEMQQLARLFAGRQVAKDMTAVVTTNPMVFAEAQRLGYVQTLQAAGVKILEGVCFYILQRLTDIRQENGWVNLFSNSAKLVNTITAHRFNTVLRRTQDCVDIACTGETR